MNLPDHLRRMARNNLWSNDRLYRAVLSLEPGEFEPNAPVSFRRSGQRSTTYWRSIILYLDFLEEGGFGAAAHDDFVSFYEPGELFAAQVAADRRLIAFCDALSESDLDRRVITDRREDGMIPERIGDILAHVFLHDIHHRGQVHAMLSGTSVKPPQLDEFLLYYDAKLREREVERLGL
ncbi:DinB family protein [Mesorhizobium sp. M7A.F.Ca.US.008.03.1.1]|uniref:DinB family protein n=1 Tax=Mesorhizobium sp. M7A.F.Ca.US.008.03.1.1 TaxID=2496742 RepID=UPI001FDFEDB7|nr:DinB family protein [Mesorhizobium sp. M7A.F.Ca.US.008.03.1.1]